jgi:hypothetical protein
MKTKTRGKTLNWQYFDLRVESHKQIKIYGELKHMKMSVTFLQNVSSTLTATLTARQL